jgi:xylulokinase
MVRALIEGQMMAIARHTRWMIERPALVSATGGASVNRSILQILADVFGAPVVRPRASNTSALGAALRAWAADEAATGTRVPWTEIAAAGAAAAGGADRIEPRPDAVEIYARLRERHARFEAAELAALADT